MNTACKPKMTTRRWRQWWSGRDYDGLPQFTEAPLCFISRYFLLFFARDLFWKTWFYFWLDRFSTLFQKLSGCQLIVTIPRQQVSKFISDRYTMRYGRLYYTQDQSLFNGQYGASVRWKDVVRCGKICIFYTT